MEDGGVDTTVIESRQHKIKGPTRKTLDLHIKQIGHD